MWIQHNDGYDACDMSLEVSRVEVFDKDKDVQQHWLAKSVQYSTGRLGVDVRGMTSGR